MKALTKLHLLLAVAAIFIITSACGLLNVATRRSTPTPLASSVITQPVATLPAEPQPSATSAPTDTPATPPTQAPTEPGAVPVENSPYTGFVAFDKAQEEFQVYDFNGGLQSRIAARGFPAWSREKVDVIGGNIYYFSEIDQQIYQSSESGLIVLPFQPPSAPYGFKISQDEKQIAWSVIDWNSTPIVSEMWVANLDGGNATQIARITSDESPAFLFIPLEWTADGKILFNRSPTGFGGYILYGGINSLYSYDPASQQLVTLVPAEEMHGLCLDHYRIDLNLVAFNCGAGGSGLRLRNLGSAAETPIPPVPDYPISGSVRFSPSGAWMAYGVAKGNPEAEAGKLVVQPTDLSAGPAEIATLGQGFYYVQSWIDENTLLVTRNEDMDTSILFRIQRDGQGVQDLAQGWFVAMAP